MCFIIGKTIEQIITEKSAGMTDAQKAKYASEIDRIVYEKLLKVDIGLVEITAGDWERTAKSKYPTLVSTDMGDMTLFTCTEAELQRVLDLDWTNLITYLGEHWDCDDFARMLAARMNYYHQLTSAMAVWGNTSQGYHAYNIVVLAEGDELVAKLIEPQSNIIFDHTGPCGEYLPEKLK